MNALEQVLLYRAGIAVFTSENSYEPQDPSRRRGEVLNLEGTTTGFAHVRGRASYASIRKMDENPSAERCTYLTTFTSTSAGETLLID